MNLDEYTGLCRRTWNDTNTLPEQILNAALGLGEAGELQNLIKKAFFHDHPMDRDAIADEAGDVLFYLTRLLDLLGIPIERVMEQNIAKLAERYPDGFSEERSRERAT